MDLRGIANSVSSQINPNVSVSVRRSTGYTIDPTTRKQVPGYATAVTGFAQIQALDGDDLKQIDGLNLQGTLRALYLRGPLAGVIRPEGKGGDMIDIGTQQWLVTKVLETWPTWTKVCIVLQGGGQM
jgi:hypothetical protein